MNQQTCCHPHDLYAYYLTYNILQTCWTGCDVFRAVIEALSCSVGGSGSLVVVCQSWRRFLIWLVDVLALLACHQHDTRQGCVQLLIRRLVL